MSQPKSKVAIWILSVMAIAIIALAGFASYQKTHQTKTASAEPPAQEVQSKTITYSGEDGKTVYDLLKDKYTVESTTGSYGVMVTSINGLKATSSEFWLYSVNGKSGDVAADQSQTKTGDQVLWEYKGF